MMEPSFFFKILKKISARNPTGRRSGSSEIELLGAIDRAAYRARGSDRGAGVPPGARSRAARERNVGAVVPILFFGVFEWLAELVAALLEIPGVKIGLLAAVIGVAFYATRIASWLQIAGSWLRMAAVIGGVGGLAIVLGMATGAIAVDVAALDRLVGELLEVIQ